MSRNEVKKREENTTYIATISGGKDSVTMCDLLLKNGYPVDYILFTDTLHEHKKMYDYIEKLKIYFRSKYNKKITILKPKSTFEHWAFGVLERGERKGSIRGLPNLSNGMCYWRRESKVKPMEKFTKHFEKVVYYIGYTLDENRSIENYDKYTFKFPLRDIFKMKEDDCKKYLIDQEMENHLYRHYSRTGCDFCPFQSEQSFYMTWKHYPETWDKMKKIESKLLKLNNVVSSTWFMNHRTCDDMEKLFKEKDKQGSLFDFSDEPLKDCFCKI
ncbi:phosphoadenosine phosphosulfate reductase family protein [Arcobacter arenosus]|uniref:Phosphoadenosine phosphosulphate reductase domain-containing protein n=1 Tax=Arcobacter arenosus TaxID=2576037 RepID=A0A5R8Y5K8_9BACT|nr:phosphoadenosine phosphosulfate reductase family protein [Arcobacter arenosus]TLP41070.1 hypothetical protein FDK22_03350 [Arcobacter arenosus]